MHYYTCRWTAKLKRECDYTDEDDGTFYMEFTKFCSIFTKIGVCASADQIPSRCITFTPTISSSFAIGTKLLLHLVSGGGPPCALHRRLGRRGLSSTAFVLCRTSVLLLIAKIRQAIPGILALPQHLVATAVLRWLV